MISLANWLFKIKTAARFLHQKIFILGLIIIILPHIVWLHLGENSYVLIHDNLDQHFTNLVLLSNSCNQDMLSPMIKISGIMGGIFRHTLGSCFNFTTLLFSIFQPLYAYILNHLTIHILGYIGMYFLLKKHLALKPIICVAVALIFGFISYYHLILGVAISGQPILLLAFLDLMKKGQWHDWLVIMLFPFFSTIVFTLPYYLPFLLLIAVVYHVKNKNLNYRYFVALSLFALISVLLDYSLIYGTFFSNIISHRTEMNKFLIQDKPSAESIIASIYDYLLFTRYHAGKISTIPVLFVLSALLFLKKKISKLLQSIVFLIAITIVMLALFPLFYYFLQNFTIVRIFTFDRYFFMMPLLWLVTFAIALNGLSTKKLLEKSIIVVAITIQFFFTLFFNKELINNFKILAQQPIAEPTFQQFFDVTIFNEIKESISTDITNFNVVSVGMFPSIAQKNGLATLDSYNNNYPLSYKVEFRKIIASELNKDHDLSDYFDHWGSRGYVFSSEIGKNFLNGKSSSLTINNLDLNITQLKLMKAKYIISALPIGNYRQLGLKFVDYYANDDSFWQLYLYKISS
jgi:hypothetical protein